MRIPKQGSPLVNIPQGQTGGRRYRGDLQIPSQQGWGDASAFGGQQIWKPITEGFKDITEAAQKIGFEVAEKKAQTRALNAYTNFSKDVDGYLYGDDGIMLREGERAIGITTETSGFLDKSIASYTKNMSEREAEIFNRQATSQRLSLMGSVSKHEGMQLEAANTQAYKSAISSMMESSLLARGDDRSYGQFAAEVERMGSEMMSKKGFDQQSIDFMTGQTRSLMNANRIIALAQDGNFEKALDLANSGEMNETDRMRVRADVEKNFLELSKAGWDGKDAYSQGGGLINSSANVDALPENLKFQAAQVAKDSGLNAGFLLGVMAAESGGISDAVSAKGARGLMQLMPETQAEMEKKYNIGGDTPEGNLTLGAAYLKEQLDAFGGNEVLALMAYNMGPGNTKSFMENGHIIKTKNNPTGKVPQETIDYVAKILGADRLPADLAARAGVERPRGSVVDNLSPLAREQYNLNQNEAIKKQHEQYLDAVKNEAIATYSQMDPVIAGRAIMVDPVLARYPEVQREVFKFADWQRIQQEKLAEQQDSAALQQRYDEITALALEKNRKGVASVLAGARPKDVAKLKKHAAEVLDGFEMPSDPVVYDDAQERVLSSEAHINIDVEYGDALNVQDRRRLKNMQDNKEINEYKRQERVFFGDDVRKYNPKITASEESALYKRFEASIPPGGYKSVEQRQKAFKDFFREVYVDKPAEWYSDWSTRERAIRGYEARDYAMSGYYPTRGADYQLLVEKYKEDRQRQGLPEKDPTANELMILYQQATGALGEIARLSRGGR